MHSFPQFSPTCFDILSWNFAHAFVLIDFRASSSAVPLRQVLKELCLFWNLEYRKNTVFCSFLLHALTYWAEILHMTLFWWTFIRPSSDGTYYGMVMSVRLSVRPTLRPVSVRPSGSPSARFPHFSPTCFDILSWNFAHDFVLMYYRSSSSVITLCQFLKELCLFVNLEYRKCTVFRSFLLHALTYWAEILHMPLFW